MELYNIPVKPYSLRIGKVSIFKLKKIFASLRKKCKSENVEIQKEKISWAGLSHPFTVQIFITGICPIPEADLETFREFYNNKREEALKENKKKRKKKRKFF